MVERLASISLIVRESARPLPYNDTFSKKRFPSNFEGPDVIAEEEIDNEFRKERKRVHYLQIQKNIDLAKKVVPIFYRTLSSTTQLDLWIRNNRKTNSSDQAAVELEVERHNAAQREVSLTSRSC